MDKETSVCRHLSKYYFECPYYYCYCCWRSTGNYFSNHHFMISFNLKNSQNCSFIIILVWGLLLIKKVHFPLWRIFSYYCDHHHVQFVDMIVTISLLIFPQQFTLYLSPNFLTTHDKYL